MIFHNLCNIVHKIGNKLVEFFKEKAFTLAEIMVALVVIGVITSILLPVAFNNLPNENVMKFKKGNATLAKVVNELVMSDRYYKDGDLGVKADGEVLDNTHENDNKYFCETFADVLAVKINNCSKIETILPQYGNSWIFSENGKTNQWKEETQTADEFKTSDFVDKTCKEVGISYAAEEIVTPDNIIYFQAFPNSPFGLRHTSGCGWSEELNRCLEINERVFTTYTFNGMLSVYTIFCMDIDGINQGEDPFGYGIRVDGKIILGARAQEWLNKNIQDKE